MTALTTDLTSLASSRAGASHRFLLKTRFLIMNAAGFAAALAAWRSGWIDRIIDGDQSHIIYLLFATFAVGVVLSGWRVWKIAAGLDRVKSGEIHYHGRPVDHRALELKLFGRISHIRHLANSLMLLGLIGTVLGLIQALTSLNGSSIGDAGAAARVIAGLVAGMGTALYLSLTGLVLSLWLNCNFQVLRRASSDLAAAILDAASHSVALAPEDEA